MAGDGKWRRPESVPFPTVWRHFTGIRKMSSGETPKFVIQDVPSDEHEAVLGFMAEHFFRDEVMCESLNVMQDPVSQKEMIDFWKDILNQNMALVAYVKDKDDQPTQQIAGVNLTGISHKTDHITADMFQGRVKRILVRDILEYASHIIDVFEHYGVNEYMTALGLCVDPAFRGQGLGLEILRARIDLGRAVGLEITMTAFTSIASQILAHRAGFQVLAEVKYEDFKDEADNPVYPGIKSKSCKIMARKINC